jgi:hypothetical protein
VGYDLGYQSTFDNDWSDVLTAKDISALRPWLGRKGALAQPGPAALRNISIPWNAAWKVFIRKTLPQEVSNTRRTFARCEELPPMCMGILVSLVYNRGTSMIDSLDFPGNRKEMRDIQAALAAGRFAEIPAALRSMKRLWPNLKGLRDRREHEAVLFEQGLGQI